MVGTAAYLSPEQAMGQPLGPATDIYSLGLVLLECIKQTVEYPGSAVESAVARLQRAPEIPPEVPQEWTDLIRSMTSLEPLERPAAADVESVLRQALVSPVSAPGELAPETTRVLPAMPFRQPSITAETELPAAAAEPAGLTGQSVTGILTLPTATAARSGVPALSPIRRRGSRFWTAAVLSLLALVAAATAVTFSLTPQPGPDVVPYPAVSGTVGDHLKELQESVKP